MGRATSRRMLRAGVLLQCCFTSRASACPPTFCLVRCQPLDAAPHLHPSRRALTLRTSRCRARASRRTSSGACMCRARCNLGPSRLISGHLGASGGICATRVRRCAQPACGRRSWWREYPRGPERTREDPRGPERTREEPRGPVAPGADPSRGCCGGALLLTCLLTNRCSPSRWTASRCEQRLFTPLAVNRWRSSRASQRPPSRWPTSWAPRIRAGRSRRRGSHLSPHISPIPPPHLPTGDHDGVGHHGDHRVQRGHLQPRPLLCRAARAAARPAPARLLARETAVSVAWLLSGTTTAHTSTCTCCSR